MNRKEKRGRKEKKFALQDGMKKIGETDESICKEENRIGPSDAPLFSAPGCVRCVASENLHTPANAHIHTRVCMYPCVTNHIRTFLLIQHGYLLRH